MDMQKYCSLLAQLIAHKSKIDTIIQEILENGYVNYQLPTEWYYTQKSKQMGGCTALHIVAKDLNDEVAKKLVAHGADCTIKNSLGETALHEAVIAVSDNFSEKLSGFLRHPIIDIILTSHTLHKVIENPLNKNGLSHFHAACIVNYENIVEFFIENGVSVNGAVNTHSLYVPGYTPLHFAVRYHSFETFQILLERGADLQAKDAKGWTPLQLLIQRATNISDIVLMGKEWSDVIRKEYKEIAHMLQTVLDHYKRSKVDILDDAGLSYLHVAMMAQNTSDTVNLLFDNDYNLDHFIKKNSQFRPGCTALHFAARSSIINVKVLLTNGANLLAKDAVGVTPFDLCLQRYKVEDIHSIIKHRKNWRDIKLSDEKTSLLDMVYAMRSENSLEIFVQNVPTDTHIPISSELWPGCTSLHVAIMLAGSTMYLEKVEILLDAGADVTVSDFHGTTPIHLAFHLNKSQVVNLLLQQTTQPILDLVDEHNISHLHVACAAGNLSVAIGMFDSEVNINSPLNADYKFKRENGQEYFFTAGSTPLHIAVITRDLEMTKLLMVRGADVNAKDAKGFTPIHRLLGPDHDAGALETSMAIVLFDLFQLMNCVTNFGLSHLHVACWANDALAVEKLLDQGADINATMSAVAPELDGDLAYKELQKFINYSPLTFAFKGTKKKMMDLIFQRFNNISAYPIDVLHSARYTTKSATISDFLRTHAATVEKWEREWNFTALHAACHRHDIGAVEKLLKQGANPNAQISSNSPDWPGLTPLHVLMQLENDEEKKMCRIIKLLLDHGADVMMRNLAGNTVIHEHVRVSGMKRKQTLLLLLNGQTRFCVDMNFSRNVAVNPALNAKGITHFHLACACNAVEIVEKFLRHNVAVNRIVDPMIHPFEGCTPLHLAALYSSQETVKLLLKHGAKVHARNREGDTPLHCAVNYDNSKFNNDHACEGVISALLGAGADLDAKNIEDETPLEVLLRTQKPSSSVLSMLLKNQGTVNIFNAADGTGYIATAIRRETSIKNIIEHPVYQAAIKSPRINGKLQSDRTVIHNIVSINKIAASIKIYTKAIEGFLKVGFDIDHQNKTGQTALHRAMYFRNAKGIAALLALGANINLLCKGETPFSLHWTFLNADVISDLDRQILSLLLKQVYKLHLINLHVSLINETTVAELQKRQFSIDSSVVEQCQDELERLGTRKIDPYDITLFGFLSETGAVASYPEMTAQKRQAVNNFFENYSFRLRHEFPEYAGILQMQHRKALARMTLRESAKYALDSLLNFSLPDLCSSLILTFLKNSEWKNLIDSQEGFLAPATKRRKID